MTLLGCCYVDGAVPCRIAFERGKERHFYFLGTAIGTSGWIILAEELPSKLNCGIIRVAAPLAGSNVRLLSSSNRLTANSSLNMFCES